MMSREPSTSTSHQSCADADADAGAGAGAQSVALFLLQLLCISPFFSDVDGRPLSTPVTTAAHFWVDF